MSDWTRIPDGAEIDLMTRDGMRRHGVELEHEVMLFLDYANGDALQIFTSSI